ncbi:uncharacterized protein LOC101861430 [Aplysia californica]|uniref:lysoplasmalogenase n=1 Tax=Aplysia californica TaxID=6500 RepID=A0ABM0JIH2_APLCA|nr:uncharacterized protein LOC101861430 [Aplysia californica]
MKETRRYRGKSKSKIEIVCDPDIVGRTYQLVTEPNAITYYVLAAYYTFAFAPYVRDEVEVFTTSVLKALPLLFYVTVIRFTQTYSCRNHSSYCKYVAIGLLLSACSDGILSYNSDYFIHAVTLYSLSNLCYIGALYQYYNGAGLSWAVFPVNMILMYGLYRLVSGYLSGLVLFVYGCFLTVTTFFAFARFKSNRTAPAYLGVVGAILLQFSNALYAIGEFAPGYTCLVSPELIMMTYYLAQLGFGLSVRYC